MKQNFTKNLTLTAAAVAVLATGSNTHAQDNNSPGLVLEELVVTARKREESLIDTPIAISVFGKQELKSAGFTDILDVAKATPGLFIEGFNQAAARVNTTPRFRGVFFSSGSRLAQTATIFLDGIYMSGGEQTISINELERIEIIKGPQSAQFGRNTFAGAINYITKDPSEELRSDIDLTLASEGEYRIAGGLEGKIAEGVTGRFGVNYANDDGDFENNAVDGQDLGDEENYSVSGTLVFKPNDRTRIKLRGSYREVDDGISAAVATAGIASHNFGGFALNNGVANLGDSVIPGGGGRTESVFRGTITGPTDAQIGLTSGADNIQAFRTGLTSDPRFGPDVAFLDYTPFNIDEFGLKLDSTRFDLHADFELTDDVSLSILAGYNEESYGRYLDFDQGPFDSFTSFAAQEIEDKNIEVRLSGTTDTFDWTLGASYVDIEILGVNGTANFFAFPIFFGAAFASTPVTTGAETTGIFGSIDYRFNDQYSLTLEGRYQEDEISDASLAAISPATIDNFLPRLTLKYEPSSDTTLYATYSEGNLPGGFNPEIGQLDAAQLAQLATLAPGAGVTFDEESLTNFELGWKQKFADGRGAVNMALFYMEREDEIFRSIELVTDTTPGAANPLRTVAFTSNGASTDIYGVEIDASYLVNESLSLGGSMHYINAEIASFPAGAGTGDFGDIFGSAASVEGQEAPRFPPFALSMNATYEQSFSAWQGFDSWYTRADFFYRGKFYDSNSNVTEVDSALDANLRFGLRGEKMGVELFVTNLFDEDAPNAASNFADLSAAVRTRPGGFFDFSREGAIVGLRDKRQVGVRLNYTF